MALVDMKAN